eukprot:COSAG02_NODE_410_length_22875_cov_43.282755_8_plen_211_part_00
MTPVVPFQTLWAREFSDGVATYPRNSSLTQRELRRELSLSAACGAGTRSPASLSSGKPRARVSNRSVRNQRRAMTSQHHVHTGHASHKAIAAALVRPKVTYSLQEGIQQPETSESCFLLCQGLRKTSKSSTSSRFLLPSSPGTTFWDGAHCACRPAALRTCLWHVSCYNNASTGQNAPCKLITLACPIAALGVQAMGLRGTSKSGNMRSR